MEIWKNLITKSWSYQISSLWNVKNKNWLILKLNKDGSWYLHCTIDRKTQRVHCLVAKYFIWERPIWEDWKMLEINHKNWVKTNNSIKNLEYIPKSENIKHSYRELWHKKYTPWKWKFWQLNANHKKVLQYDIKWVFINKWNCITDINKKLWYDVSNIVKCCKWKRKTAWGFKWEYSIT